MALPLPLRRSPNMTPAQKKARRRAIMSLVGDGATPGASAGGGGISGFDLSVFAEFDPGIAVQEADPWTLNGHGWLDFADSALHLNGTFPADGAEVAFARGRPPTIADAVRYASNNLPTFAAAVPGTSPASAGVRFTSASSQVMGFSAVTNPYGINRFQAADLALTLAIVAVPAAAVSGTATPFEVSKHDTTPSNDTRERAAFQLTATAMNFICQGNSGDGTVATGSGATVAVTPTTDTPFIAIGRHGSAGAPDQVNRLLVRQGGATTNSGATAATSTVNTASTARWDGATIGARFRGGMGQYFNGYVLFVRAWNRYLSDAERDALLAKLQADYGVA